MRTFPEGSQNWAEIRFLDKNDKPFVPTSAQWRLEDEASGVELVPWTAIPVSAKVDIAIPATANRILADFNNTETRVFTVQSDPSTDGQLSQEGSYKVTNLKGFV